MENSLNNKLDSEGYKPEENLNKNSYGEKIMLLMHNHHKIIIIHIIFRLKTVGNIPPISNNKLILECMRIIIKRILLNL